MMSKKSPPVIATVQSVSTVTPNMQRIVLHSNAFSNYPADCEGGYVKLLFNHQGSTDLTLLDEGERPVMRTYSIKRYDAQAADIELDMVRHASQDQQAGIASQWACSATVGDTISVQGPGPLKRLSQQADWFFLLADMTALSALSVTLKSLPRSATGHAVIEVASEADIQAIESPEGVEVEWIFKPLGQASSLSQVAMQKPWLQGNAGVWCACEFDTMRALRQYFRSERHVAKDNLYISSYWKSGVTEDGHKVLKRQDAENS